MKRPILLISLALLTSTSHAQNAEPPKVTVYGTATTEAVPDIMHWRLNVRTKAPDIEGAAKAHATSVQSVLTYLKKQDLPESCIQTSGMQFGENLIYKNREKIKDGYVASTDISFKLEDLEKYKALWIGVPKLPDVSLNGVTMDTSKRIKHRNETRVKALRAAREKARALAQTLDAGIGKPLLIEEVVDNPRLMYGNSNNIAMAEEGGGGGESLAPGRIPITMRVRVSFLLK